jgi:hypothetical protein
MFIDKSSEKQKEYFKHGINQWTGEPNKPVFYTEEMKKRVHEIKKPSMLLMDVVMYPDFLALRLYEDNFIQFDGIKKEMVIDYVSKVKKLIESYGVRCELEGKPSERIL